MLYIIASSGPNYPEWVDKLKKLAHVFYTFTQPLNSFIVPCIKLGAWLQGNFDLKRRDKVNKNVCFQVVPYCHCPSSAIRVVFFNFWCPVTSALLECCRFPARDFFPKRMEYTVFVVVYFCFVLCNVRHLRSGPNYSMVVQITKICSKAFVPWWKAN